MQILKTHKMSKRQIGTVITDFFEADLYLFQSEESFSIIFLFFFFFFFFNARYAASASMKLFELLNLFFHVFRKLKKE